MNVDDLEEIAPFLAALAKLFGVTESSFDDQFVVLFAHHENRTAFVGWHIQFLDDFQCQFLPLKSRRLFDDSFFVHQLTECFQIFSSQNDSKLMLTYQG